MNEDMPRTWWDGTDYRWLYDGPRQKLPGAYALSGDHFPAAVGPDWVELQPVSAEHVDARALELSYWFGRLQYANADDLPRLRGLMRDRIEELDEQGDAIAYTAVSDAPAAPVETRTEWAVSGCDIGDDENFVDPVSERLDAEANAYDLRVSGRYRDVHVVSRTVTTINSEWKRVDDV